MMDVSGAREVAVEAAAKAHADAKSRTFPNFLPWDDLLPVTQRQDADWMSNAIDVYIDVYNQALYGEQMSEYDPPTRRKR
jgi:hypothetical protein